MITAKFIEENHPLVKELMLKRQEEQGNRRDWGAFEGDVTAQKVSGGFNWGHTHEDYGPWVQALRVGHFPPLYALHPEWSEPTTISTEWSIEKCFEELRKSLKHHLGGGDIRLTVEMQDEICRLVKAQAQIEVKAEEPAPLIDGEWYWVKLYETSKWEAGLYFDGHIGESEPFFETRTCIYYVEEVHAIHPEPIKKPE